MKLSGFLPRLARASLYALTGAVPETAGLVREREQQEELLRKNAEALEQANNQLVKEIEEQKQAKEQIKMLVRFPADDPSPVVRIDADGTVVYGNASSAPLLRAWQSGVGLLVPDVIKDTVHGSLASQKGVEMEHFADGRIYSLQVVPFPDSGYVNVYGRDITKRKNTEDQLARVHEHLENEVLARTGELRGTNELLRMEINERAKAEAALSKRQQVLESIYAIETTFSESLENAYDQIALTIAHIINVPYAAVGQVEKGRFRYLSQLTNGVLTHEKDTPVAGHPCGIVYREKKICHFNGDLRAMFPEQAGSLAEAYSSYVSIPILSKKGEVNGMICVLAKEEMAFEDNDVHLMEIFARYMGHEIEHGVMDEQLRSAHEISLLGTLASGVAHEVRNPLNGILAISEALFQSIGDNKEYLPYLEHIRNQVHRLSALMKDLLDLGKPLMQSEFMPHPLDELIRTVIDTFRHSSAHKMRTIDFVSAPSAGVCLVMANSTKLQQVFFNLLENACDHSPENEPVVVEISRPEELFVVVRVVDRGKGIPPELIDRVFEPFFTTRKGGTGLGLSIVKHIVEMHLGAISLSNNTPPPGLTVEVRLPHFAEQK
jgi:signal transduction histidine kinase